MWAVPRGGDAPSIPRVARDKMLKIARRRDTCRRPKQHFDLGSVAGELLKPRDTHEAGCRQHEQGAYRWRRRSEDPKRCSGGCTEGHPMESREQFKSVKPMGRAAADMFMGGKAFVDYK